MVLPQNVFSEAPNLEKIDLGNNQLTTIEDFAFNGLSKLATIYLTNNNLTILKRNTFAGAENISVIDLQNNRIEVIEEGTFNLAHLRTLYVSYNFIRTLADNIFDGTPSLSTLSLAQNGLTHIGQSLYKLNKLSSLYLDRNNVHDIDLSSLAKLPAIYQLSLENSGFRLNEGVSITPATTVPSHLHHLDLSENEITDADVLKRLGSFGFVNLKNFWLDGNNLTNVEGLAEVRQKFPNIVQLGLSENRLTCEWMEAAVETLKPLNVRIVKKTYMETRLVKSFKGVTCV